MKKENIEANDLRFRDKLSELRSSLDSRRQKSQDEGNPRIGLKAIIPLLILVVFASYLTGKKIRSYQPVTKNVTDNLQISKSGQAPFAVQKIAVQIHHEPVIPEIENTSLSDVPDKLSADTAVISGNSEPVIIAGDSSTNSILSSPIPPLSYNTRISRLFTCSQVNDRECVGQKSVFLLNEHRKAYVWMEVHSDNFPYTLTHVYYHEGQKYCEVPLEIKFPRMRTWSNITLRNTSLRGSWYVEIVAEDGAVLEDITFKVR